MVDPIRSSTAAARIEALRTERNTISTRLETERARLGNLQQEFGRGEVTRPVVEQKIREVRRLNQEIKALNRQIKSTQRTIRATREQTSRREERTARKRDDPGRPTTGFTVGDTRTRRTPKRGVPEGLSPEGRPTGITFARETARNLATSRGGIFRSEEGEVFFSTTPTRPARTPTQDTSRTISGINIFDPEARGAIRERAGEFATVGALFAEARKPPIVMPSEAARGVLAATIPTAATLPRTRSQLNQESFLQTQQRILETRTPFTTRTPLGRGFARTGVTPQPIFSEETILGNVTTPVAQRPIPQTQPTRVRIAEAIRGRPGEFLGREPLREIAASSFEAVTFNPRRTAILGTGLFTAGALLGGGTALAAGTRVGTAGVLGAGRLGVAAAPILAAAVPTAVAGFAATEPTTFGRTLPGVAVFGAGASRGFRTVRPAREIRGVRPLGPVETVTRTTPQGGLRGVGFQEFEGTLLTRRGFRPSTREPVFFVSRTDVAVDPAIIPLRAGITGPAARFQPLPRLPGFGGVRPSNIDAVLGGIRRVGITRTTRIPLRTGPSGFPTPPRTRFFIGDRPARLFTEELGGALDLRGTVPTLVARGGGGRFFVSGAPAPTRIGEGLLGEELFRTESAFFTGRRLGPFVTGLRRGETLGVTEQTTFVRRGGLTRLQRRPTTFFNLETGLATPLEQTVTRGGLTTTQQAATLRSAFRIQSRAVQRLRTPRIPRGRRGTARLSLLETEAESFVPRTRPPRAFDVTQQVVGGLEFPTTRLPRTRFPVGASLFTAGTTIATQRTRPLAASLATTDLGTSIRGRTRRSLLQTGSGVFPETLTRTFQRGIPSQEAALRTTSALRTDSVLRTQQGIISNPAPIPFPPGIPTIPRPGVFGFNFGRERGFGGFAGPRRRGFRRIPSLATLLGASPTTGPRGVQTGLEVRPIPRRGRRKKNTKRKQ